MTDLGFPDADVHLDELPGESHYEPLRAETQWRQRNLLLYGKQVRQPRLTAWYGDASYSYSGIVNDPLPWTPRLLGIKAEVEALLGIEFNSVLLNLYRDGQDSISPHSDDEKELGDEPIIASVSYGDSRVMRFTHRRGLHPDQLVDLTDRSLLVMMGATQKNWKHGIAKVANAGPRINLTFRRVIG